LQFTPPSQSINKMKRQKTMISDSIRNYQTIASLAYEDEFFLKYGMHFDSKFKAGLRNTEQIQFKKILLLSTLYGFCQSFFFVGYIVSWLVLAERIKNHHDREDGFMAVF